MKFKKIRNVSFGEYLGVYAGVVKDRDYVVVKNVKYVDATDEFKGTLKILNLKNQFLKDEFSKNIINHRINIGCLELENLNKRINFRLNGSAIETYINDTYFDGYHFLKIRNREFREIELSKFFIETSNILLASKASKIFYEIASIYKTYAELAYIFDKEIKYPDGAEFHFTDSTFHILPRFIRYLESKKHYYKEIYDTNFDNASITLYPKSRSIYINTNFFDEDIIREIKRNDDINMLIEKLKDKYLEFKRPVDI